MEQIEETRLGMYVWEMPDGNWVGDNEQPPNFMHIVAMKDDVNRIAELNAAARGYGVTEGEPKFLSGHRPVTDEEYEEQLARLHDGVTPDPYDIPTMLEQYRNGK